MSEVKATIDALSAPFDPKVIRRKPGSDKRPALPYVSHGLVTKRLNEVCPGWSTRVVEMHTFMDGKGNLQCAGVTLELTVPGVGSRVEFGTAERSQGFGKDAKNAMSDALKRCAMRFGVALDLWESAEENDDDAQGEQPAAVERRPAPARPAPRQEPRPLRPSAPAAGAMPEQVEAVRDALAAKADRETPEGALAWLAGATDRDDLRAAHAKARLFVTSGMMSLADVAKAYNEADSRLRAATA